MADRVKRTKQFAIRLSAEERARVDRLVDYYGIDVSSLFRMIVKKEYDTVVDKFRGKNPFSQD